MTRNTPTDLRPLCGERYAVVAAAGAEMPPPRCERERGHDGDHGGVFSADQPACASTRPSVRHVARPGVEGMGPDAETVTNEHGAKQSRVPYRFDLIDPASIFAMTKVLAEGAEKYGADNWRGIPLEDHLNHLIAHAYAALAGDTSDDHLSHVMCRAMFADAMARSGWDDQS